MDSIGPTFKNLRGRGSLESKAVNVVSTSALFQEKVRDLEMELSRKRAIEEDDPFFEKVARTEKSVSMNSSAANLASGFSSGAQFIKDQNLRSVVSRERTPVGDTSVPHDFSGSKVDIGESIVGKPARASTNGLPPGTVLEATDAGCARNGAGEVADVFEVDNTGKIAKDGDAGEIMEVEAGDAVEAGMEAEIEDDDVALEVLEEMHKLEENFPVLAERYRLLDKIGEGTFSTVYKAEAVDGAVMLGSQLWKSPPLKQIVGKKSRKEKKKTPLVALKQIYVTSSPNRIHNELNILFMLSGNSHVAPLLDILRYQDQVLAILPYYQHADFRDFYRDLPVKGIKTYMWELFQGMEFMHSKGIIHRDLKPTNFLYDPFKGKGVLVDFGLAEKMNSHSQLSVSNSCPCLLKDRSSLNKTHSKRLNIKAAYPKVDQRPPRRANRAGTRGFRAPEVLLKCTNQSTKIDIWSAGIIGLSLITRKFPLFNSPDDIDALIEIMLLFGIEKMSKCAELHGCGLEISMPNVQRASFNGNLIKFLVTILSFEKENECLPEDSVIHDTLKFLDRESNTLLKPTLDGMIDVTPEAQTEHLNLMEEYSDFKHLLQLLYGCLSMDPVKRFSASQLLKMPFFSEMTSHTDDEVLL